MRIDNSMQRSEKIGRGFLDINLRLNESRGARDGRRKS